MDATAINTFASAFNATADKTEYFRAYVSRICYLEFSAWCQLTIREMPEVAKNVIKGFILLIPSTLIDTKALVKLDWFFPGVWEHKLLSMDYLIETGSIPNAVSVASLMETAINNRHKQYFTTVKDIPDLTDILFAIAMLIEPQIKGGIPLPAGLNMESGNQVSCLGEDWNNINAVVRSL